jgi:hypothetical protein
LPSASLKHSANVLHRFFRRHVHFLGKFPARPSNKSRFLLWPCKIVTFLFDPDFIFLPFHGPAVTSAVNYQLSDCEKTIVPLAKKAAAELLRARAPTRLLLRTCGGRHAAAARRCVRAPWRLRRVRSPGGGPPPRVPLGSPPPHPWGDSAPESARRRPPPARRSPAGRLCSGPPEQRRLEATGEDEGLPSPPAARTPPASAPVLRSNTAWRPRERTRGSRDRMGEMGSGVCVGVAGVVQSKKFLLLTSKPQTLTDWPNGSNGRAMEENENKKEATKERFSFPEP